MTLMNLFKFRKALSKKTILIFLIKLMINSITFLAQLNMAYKYLFKLNLKL